jgi:glycosyltransferase involved in cell wall biosynthesis
MKILQVINSLSTGGAEKLVLDTVPLYNKRGIQVDVLVLQSNEQPFLKKLKMLKCCQVSSLGQSSVYNPIHIFKIIPYLKKYDVVHVHLFPALYWFAIANTLSFSKTKLVFTEHNTNNRRTNSTLFRALDKIVYSCYQSVICITAEVKTVLLKHLNELDPKFIVINNGVDLNVIYKAEAYGKKFVDKSIDSTDKLLIQVASFREQKDQPTLIKALMHLPATVKLLLVGDGILRKECEALVLQLQLQSRVFFLGLRMDIPSLLKTADMVVLSSKHEGLSLSSIEGMSAGKPFLASDVPGLSDIVGGAGVLFDCGNEKQLASKIELLLNDKDYYAKVVNQCQERVHQYDIKNMIEKHITLYKKVYQK